MNLAAAATGLWLIPVLPALAALLIFVGTRSWKPGDAGKIATAGVGLSAIAVVYHSISLLTTGGDIGALRETLWVWLDAGFISSHVGFHFDRISMIFCLIITIVGTLIHLFSTEYMAGDEGEKRYFGFLSLFVASMLVLVTAGDAFFMFVGWEGVGACSFALIGHYYTKKENASAAFKAFLVTRIGDVFLLLGVVLCAVVATVDFAQLQSLGQNPIKEAASPFGLLTGTALATIIGILLLLGAAGKSAQLPLQTWLPDAMAGPTPVSALIHAATMVTAGVYLIARFHPVFAQSPTAMTVVAIVGLGTALYGATSALVQVDIKRILAYSTISQIGFMVLALGVGAYGFAIFHFVTHAFYKALLFLGAGYVIHALDGEQNVYRMGGLRYKLPKVYWMMLAGAASLAGLPFITAGFYSKDAILWASLTTSQGSIIFYAVGLLTALLTSIYSFRLIALVFHGEARKEHHVHHGHTGLMEAAMLPLAILALVGGFINLPILFPFLDGFLRPVFGASQLEVSHSKIGEIIGMLVGGAVAITGAGLGLKLFTNVSGKVGQGLPTAAVEMNTVELDTASPYAQPAVSSAYRGWDFDRAYDLALVQPFRKLFGIIAWLDQVVLDGLYEIGAMVVRAFHSLLSITQNSNLTRYAMVMLGGAALFVVLILLNMARA
jgi:NADH-quinone oxidoreductase subunit L